MTCLCQTGMRVDFDRSAVFENTTVPNGIRYHTFFSGSIRVTTFLRFLDTWKCLGIRLRSVKIQVGKRPKVREKSGGLCSQGKI